MNCDLCEAKATIFFTNIIDGKMKKVSLCEDCAKEKEVSEASGYDIADLLIGVGEEETVPSSAKGSVCNECGFTHADFKKIGRLGCSHCYETFFVELDDALLSMHKGSRHTGKIPARLFDELVFGKKLTELNNRLNTAVLEEDFENAAKIRDEISVLNKKNKKLNPPKKEEINEIQ